MFMRKIDVGSDSGEDPAIRRAEQNRVAQRAFRQRKQQYIKWLESKAEELDEVYRIMALVRTENQQLCQLVLELNDRLQSGTKKDQEGGVTTTSSTSAKDTKITTPTPSSTSPLTSPLNVTATGAAIAALTKDEHAILDLSISREVSRRLMNLTMTPGTILSGDRENGLVVRPKYQPRSSPISNGDSSKGMNVKSKSAFKQSMQLKRQEQNHWSLVQQQQLQQQPLVLQLHGQDFAVLSAPPVTTINTALAATFESGTRSCPLFPTQGLTASPTLTTTTPSGTLSASGIVSIAGEAIFPRSPGLASTVSPLRRVQSGKTFNYFLLPKSKLVELGACPMDLRVESRACGLLLTPLPKRDNTDAMPLDPSFLFEV
jgi:hypothetical protein